MEFALLWLVCGIAAAVVATSKNRSGFGWFFGGVLLGPIGLLMVGFMPPIKPGSHGVEPRACPFCAEEIQPAAIVCKHCGRDVPLQQTSIDDGVTVFGNTDESAAGKGP